MSALEQFADFLEGLWRDGEIDADVRDRIWQELNRLLKQSKA